MGRTQGEMAQSIGVNQSTWSSYERGAKQPALEQLHKMIEVFDLSPDWLLFGKQPMHRLPSASTEPQEGFSPQRPVPIVGEIAAGALIESYVTRHPDTYLPLSADELSAPGDTVFGLEVHGHSMTPWMWPGDVAVCSSAKGIEVGDDVAVYQAATGESSLKRLERFDRRRGEIKLRPMNPQMEAFLLKLDPGDQVKR
ncbi:MAG: XRE family transcriptional regulator, partial [Bacteroidota bacterium]